MYEGWRITFFYKAQKILFPELPSYNYRLRDETTKLFISFLNKSKLFFYKREHPKINYCLNNSQKQNKRYLQRDFKEKRMEKTIFFLLYKGRKNTELNKMYNLSYLYSHNEFSYFISFYWKKLRKWRSWRGKIREVTQASILKSLLYPL